MIYAFGDCELDDQRFELRRAGEACHLEPQVLGVLLHLIRHRDRVVPKTELLDEVWGNRFVTDSALTSRLKTARRAIGDTGREQRVIRTVHGRGYRFVAPVEQRTTVAPPPAPVGRAWELERLTGLLDRAVAGERRVVFVTGEPGIGKTTVVDAFLASARPGVMVARGQCIEHRGTPEPYLPVFDALARLIKEDEAAVVALLTRFAPSWLAQMPAVADPDELASLQRRALGATRERMLREVAGALEAAGPLVLVLEDLHWADPSTVDLVEWLARRDTPARLLVVGTYRPADAAAHPIGGTGAELRLRGLATELALAQLGPDDVRTLLERRLDSAELPGELGGLVHRRTDGVPLFAAQLTEAWIDDGVLAHRDGGWRLTEQDPPFPAGLRRLVELQLERLGPADLAILEAAAVAGAEPATRTVAAAAGATEDEAEERCATLARHGRFLRAGDPVRWPDGTVSAGFGFLHDLYRDVLYDRVPAGRRARMHAAVAADLEAALGPDSRERVAELAAHLLHGRDDAKAVRYLQLAAEQALARSANQEAAEHLGNLLRVLERLPAGAERDQAEAAARLWLGPCLIATHGFAAAEVEDTYTRAVELCGRLGTPPLLPFALHGLAAVHEFRGRYHESEPLLERIHQLGDTGLVAEADELLACTTFHQGAFATSIAHAGNGLARHEREEDYGLYLAPFGEHSLVACHGWAARAEWFAGRPGRALDHADRGVEIAARHPYSLSAAMMQRAFLQQHIGDRAATLRCADETLEVAAEHGFPFRGAQATIVRGWALGDAGELRAGLTAYRATGAEMEVPYYLGMLAEILGGDEGLAVVDEALAASGTWPFFFQAELHRIRGDLLRDPADAAGAYRAALAIATGQRAPSLVLRTTIRLCRAGAPGARDDLRAALGPVEGGSGTPDVIEARALLG